MVSLYRYYFTITFGCANVCSYSLFIRNLFFKEPVGAEREVLIRDRLVFLLCDQLAAYLYNGTFPEPVKVMPQKYKDSKLNDKDFQVK